MIVKLMAEHHSECLSLKGGCRGSSESTLVKIPHCWKSRVTAQIQFRSSGRAKMLLLQDNKGTNACSRVTGEHGTHKNNSFGNRGQETVEQANLFHGDKRTGSPWPLGFIRRRFRDT